MVHRQKQRNPKIGVGNSQGEGSCLLSLLFSFRSDSALAQLYGTSATLEHHHFNHAVMILQSEVRPATWFPHAAVSWTEKWEAVFKLDSDPGTFCEPITCQRPCSRSSWASSLGSAEGFAESLTGTRWRLLIARASSRLPWRMQATKGSKSWQSSPTFPFCETQRHGKRW